MKFSSCIKALLPRFGKQTKKEGGGRKKETEGRREEGGERMEEGGGTYANCLTDLV